MSDKMAVIFMASIVVFVGGIIIATIAYYIARFLRGSIKLSLPCTAFDPGSTIKGEFALHAKKDLEGNKLIVSLIGVQITKTYQKDGKTSSQSQEIYRNETLVEPAKSYPAGYTADYDFELPVPNINTPGLMNSPLNQPLNTAMNLLGGREIRQEWRVEARLDAQGVDLADSQKISLNTQNWV